MPVVCSSGNPSPTISFLKLEEYSVKKVVRHKWLKLTTKPKELIFKSSGSVMVVSNRTNSLYFVGKVKRFFLKVVLVRVNEVFVRTGGSGNTQMWCYNIPADQWKLLPADQSERIRPLATMVNGRYIYVFGGYTDTTGGKASSRAGVSGTGGVVFLSTAAVFDTESPEDGWATVSPMSSPRSGGQALTIGNKIYLFGGRRTLK